MYRDIEQWLRVRHLILVEGVTRKQVARETGISPNSVRKMLRHPKPVVYGPRERVCPKLGPYMSTIRRLLRATAASPRMHRISAREIYEHIRDQGYSGSSGTVRNYIASLTHQDRTVWEAAYDRMTTLDRRSAVSLMLETARKSRWLDVQSAPGRKSATSNLVSRETLRAEDMESANRSFAWMRKVLQRKIADDALRQEVGDVPDLCGLQSPLYEGRLSERNRALAILATARGWDAREICGFLCIDKKTYQAYLNAFSRGGTAALFARRDAPNRKVDSESLKDLVFSILHEPPSNYGINRTTWTSNALSQILSEKRQPACSDTIRKITRQAGWRWRKAREVLTSTDPEYSEKVQRVRSTLSNLQPDEAFFSIDEFGPFAVKMKGGLTLTAPGELRIVPQWQKSRGTLIVTAALELSSNQITHFYSERKNTSEMIRMAETLIKAYSRCRKLYLSWDAASWHTSKRLQAWIAEHNDLALRNGAPNVATVPLPSSAQFLNVIESIFSGMARAIIHNSDYADPEDAKSAIDRYFAERNAEFRLHPARAGERIGGMSASQPYFQRRTTAKIPITADHGLTRIGRFASGVLPSKPCSGRSSENMKLSPRSARRPGDRPGSEIAQCA